MASVTPHAAVVESGVQPYVGEVDAEFESRQHGQLGTSLNQKDDMSEFPDSIAIMFPANYPDDKSDAHCTLIWLGNIPDATFTPEDVLAVLRADDYTPNVEYTPLPPKIFGKYEDRVVVLPLEDADGSLNALRTKLETGLAAIGITSPSEYTTYVPHVTTEDYIPGQTRMANYPVPEKIKLGPAELWWGDEHIA